METPTRTSINMRIKQSLAGKVFTSGSAIRGTILITPSNNTAVAAVEISFTGVTTITLDSIDNFKSTTHTFLSLKMPSINNALPSNRILMAGTTYELPFYFIVPYRLSINACIHRSNADVIDQHTQLPPSSGNWGNNETVSKDTHILYAIYVEVTQRQTEEPAKAKTDRARWPVNILPALPEDPPLEFAPHHGDYKACRTQLIRTSYFKRAIGSVTASIKQPRAIRLAHDGCGAFGSCAEVHFLFRAFKAGATPPKVVIKSGTIASTTLHTSNTSAQLPCEPEHKGYVYSYQSVYPIILLPPNKAQWTRLHLEEGENDMPCCNSPITKSPMQGSGKVGADDDSSHREATAEYTTSLRIPFTLLCKGSGFHLPTFHSCLISRIYTLRLNFAVGSTNSNLSLTVTLQISVPATYDSDVPELPSYDKVIACDEGGDSALHCNASMIEGHLGDSPVPLLPQYDAGAT